MVRGTGRAALVAAAIVLAGLAAAVTVVLLLDRVDEEPMPEETGVAEPETPQAPDAPRAPLTGVPIAGAADLDHPAVAVKISDVRQAQPQVGVDRADIVFVEPIGVSYTRLAAVFHSDMPETVGPVRSVRPADAPLLGPLSPVFGNTMGAEWVLDYIDDVADVDNLGSLRVTGTGAYVVDDARPRPDQVFARSQVLLDLSERTERPEPYFAHAREGELASAEAAGGQGHQVVVPYGPEWDITWTYDEETGRYLRDQPWGEHTAADGSRVSAVNVLVLEVESEITKIGDGAGAPVPVLRLVDASGPFTALAAGRSVTGRWSKGGVNEAFELRTDAGDELLLSPGNTWVELPAP